ncbi:hypothetical protein EFA69_06465 [Rufibacter immobilis]|uniref:Uncharacterized protein n=1 Tax=Rufibacter immobilis TaxID=1348778 RepID=A0A3M9MZK0_9BACT|nr:hypothetical protein [Rufibacter immobilis]RNI30930.1 hypothetical protein EFA69_06465 [Rufibacter immobilis]
MKTIEVTIDDSSYGKFRDLLESLKYVRFVNDGNERFSIAANPDIITDNDEVIVECKTHSSTENVHSRSHGNVTPNTSRHVDEITLASQDSLAEDWDSEEDDRYDEIYRQQYSDNSTTSGSFSNSNTVRS